MSDFPKKPELEVDLIDQFARGYQISQVLFTACSLNIFKRLDSPKTASELSDDMGTDPSITKKLLDVLVALDLLILEGEKYRNFILAMAQESRF